MSFVTADAQVRGWVEEATDTTAVIPTNYGAFDAFLKRGGLRRGHLAGLLGRSNVGKTALACNIVSRMVLEGVPVLFSSQEMTAAEVTNRLLACAYGLPVNYIEDKMREGNFDTRWLDKYRHDFARLVLYTKSQPTHDNLSTAMADYEGAVGVRPAVVVQDHLQLMSQQGLYGNEGVKVSRTAQLFKELARDEGVVVLNVNQTGRANESDATRRNHGHIPLSMEDMMWGGEQHYDVIFGVYRPELNPDLYDPAASNDKVMENHNFLIEWGDKAVLQVVKNRHYKKNPAGVPVNINWDVMQWFEVNNDRRSSMQAA